MASVFAKCKNVDDGASEAEHAADDFLNLYERTNENASGYEADNIMSDVYLGSREQLLRAGGKIGKRPLLST